MRGSQGAPGAPQDTQQTRDRTRVPLQWSQPLWEPQPPQQLRGTSGGVEGNREPPATCPPHNRGTEQGGGTTHPPASPAPSNPPPCCPQPQSPRKSPRLTSCEQNLVFPLLFYFLKQYTSSPRNSTSYLSRVPRGTLSFGARGAAGLPGPGGMRVPHRGHPTCPELSSCLLLKATFRFGVMLNCWCSHVSCLLPRERGAGRTHMGSLSPQFPKQRHCWCHWELQ